MTRPAKTSNFNVKQSWLRCLLIFLASAATSVWAGVNVPLTWNASTDTNVVGYKIYYGGASQTYTNSLDVGNVTNAVVPGLVAGTTYYFAATTYTSAGLESKFSNEASYTTTNPLPIVNSTLPTLDSIADLTLSCNAGVQSIDLTGISPGGAVQKQSSNKKNPAKKLKIVATSSNPKIISTPKVTYTSPNSTGGLKLKPVANASGTVTINVTVTGGTANESFTRSFTVTVLPKTKVAAAAQLVSATQVAAPATLTTAGMVNGQFTFTVNGTAGSSYIVQSTTDFVNWTSVETNTAPFLFSDPNSSASGNKFYRAASL